MSLQRLAHELQSRELHDIEAVENLKVVINEFHKNPVECTQILKVFCDKYPHAFERRIKAESLFVLVQKSIEAAGAEAAVQVLTEAVLKSLVLAYHEKDQIRWLEAMFDRDVMAQQARAAVLQLNVSPRLRAKLRQAEREPGLKQGPDAFVDPLNKFKEALALEETYSTVQARFSDLRKLDYLPVSSPKVDVPPDLIASLEQELEENQEFITSPSKRLETISLFKSLFRVYTPGFQLSQENLLGSWIIGCVRSTNRAVRLAAIELLEYFVNDDLPADKLYQLYNNRLKLTLSSTTLSPHSETVVAAWAVGARGCNNFHLQYFLLKIVAQLSSSSPVKTAFVLEQLRIIADSKRVTPYQLFMPFWQTVATKLVMDKSEDVLAQFCDFCDITPAVFYSRTAKFTLPTIILQGKHELLQKVVQAEKTTPERLIERHYAPIIAFLSTVSPNSEDFVERILRQVSRQAAVIGLRCLQGKPKRTILVELLKITTTIEDKTKIANSLQQLYPSGLDRDATFHLMAVVTQDLCFNSAGRLFPVNRVHYLEGLEFLIRSTNSDLTIVGTQMFTLFQSQLTDPLTSWYTLRAWLAFLEELEAVERGHDFYDLTLSVIAYKWNSFTPALHDQAAKIWVFLLESPHYAQYVEHHLFPSLPDAEFQEKFMQRFGNDKKSKELRCVQRRLHQESFYVVYQGVKDLKELLGEQMFVDHLISSNDKTGGMDDTFKALLSVGRRFKDEDLRVAVAECLGRIGALDPYRIDLRPQERERVPIELDSFGVFKESQQWVGHLIQHYIVPEIQATTDPDVQMYLGYEIQELLKFCGIRVDESGDGNVDFDGMFEDADQRLYSLVEPFLWTKYKIGNMQTVAAKYPIFKSKITYREWLRQFSFDMMGRATGANAATVFSHLAKLFCKDREAQHFEQIALFALPYAILNALLYDPSTTDLLLLEFETVLNQKVDAHVAMILKCVFRIFDYFAVWLQQKRLTGVSQELSVIQRVSDGVSASIMGQRAFECHNYPRAIRYWEQVTDHTPEMLHDVREMYAHLDDVDAMIGISKLQNAEPTKGELVQRFKKLRQWDAALATYDAYAGELSVWQTEDAEAALECYQNRPELLLITADIIPDAARKPRIAAMASTSAWRIGRWDDAVRWSRLDTHSIPLCISRAIFACNESGPDSRDFNVSVREGRLLVMEDICKHEVTSLTQIRQSLIYLQAMYDMDCVSRHGLKLKERDVAGRLARVGPDTEARDYLLSLYRAVKCDQIGWTYYQGAMDMRESGNYTRALEYVLQATTLGVKLAGLEHARLLWAQGDQNQALEMLHRMLQHQRKMRKKGIEQPYMLEQTEMLYTSWVDASGYGHTDEIVQSYYQQIKDAKLEGDTLCFLLAKHWLKIYDYQLGMEPSGRDSLFYNGKLTRRIVEALVKSLRTSAKHVEEALPKFLTMWLDFAHDVENHSFTDVDEMPEGKLYRDERAAMLATIQRSIEKNIKSIPAYFFYGALPQIMSRITSVSDDTFKVIRQIVTLVCRTYPDRAVWSIIESYNSSQADRQARGQQIVDDLVKGENGSQIGNALAAIETLVGLCSVDLSQDRSATQTLKSLRFDQRSLIKSKLAIPINKNMSCVLPDPGTKLRDYVPFARRVEFYHIDNEVVVMSSLQRPKKITGRGSDGMKFALLCKSRDDVRKDARLMDFTSTINKLLNRDPAAKSRHLQVHSYKVTPLMEQGGIIEWVDGAVPTRKLVVDLMTSNNIPFNISRWATIFDSREHDKLRKAFDSAIKELKPVLHQYFINSFPDPMDWLRARTLFTRSAAVMSIVGYILGLGDRHLENILLVENTGGVLHVDFDCLFDKGSTLARPELVPFRLTQNMIDAMGMMRYEGPFRRSCEITLELLSKNEGLLLTILEPFVYDPVVTGNSRDKVRNKLLQPRTALERIRRKLQLNKMHDPKDSVLVSAPMSVQGLVEDLIKTAIDPSKLCEMYVGWCPFL